MYFGTEKKWGLGRVESLSGIDGFKVAESPVLENGICRVEDSGILNLEMRGNL